MAELMKGKRGLIMGVANNRSIAWGIAQQLGAQGAELAFSYANDRFRERVEPLAASIGSNHTLYPALMKASSGAASTRRASPCGPPYARCGADMYTPS